MSRYFLGKAASVLAVTVACSLPVISLAQSTATQTAPSTQQNAAPSAAPPNFVNLVKQYGNTVVHISTTRSIPGGPGISGIPPDHPMYEFFRRFMPPEGPPGGPQGEAQGVGSGFIIDADGYILTNAHVVSESDVVTVRLTDKREFKAKVLGTDTYTDVALLKIEAGNLPVAKIGEPKNVLPGEWVVAIGAPFGFENSVTAGVVSAKGRFMPSESYVPFIQTDVAVNPGNSGGPLFNMNGEVIGINSMIYSQTGGYMGVAFAIPIDLAINVAEQLRATGKVSRSRIGVQVQELSRELAASFGLQEARGALVAAVESGAPADKAGVQVGDVILSVNGQPVQNASDLARLVASNKPGTAITLEVWRNKQRVPLKVTTAEVPTPASDQAQRAGGETVGKAGLSVTEIPDEQRKALQLDHGVLVHRAEGAALQAGIQPGDIILRLNNTQVKNVAQLRDLIAKNAGQNVALLVRRGQDALYVPLRIPS
jgi:serine protease Do